MNERLQGQLRLITAQFVWIAALLHVGVGVVQWYRRVQYGIWLPQDVRFALFILSGLALIGGLYFAARAEDRRPYYLAGIAIMLGYVAGYFAWHFFGHRPYILWGPGQPYDSVSRQWFLDHLLAGPIEFGAILVEVFAAVLLAVLYRTEN